jgi:glucose-1-phosphate thymidylyltransferase
LAKSSRRFNDIIGLIPAAGQATRLGHLPCSKEIYPLGIHSSEGEGVSTPFVACHHLLHSLRKAAIRKVFIVLRRGKWDIPTYLGDGSSLDMHIGYLLMGLPYGSPYTLDQAWPFVRKQRVAVGFADVLFKPVDAFVHLIQRQERQSADVVLGLFPSDQPHKMDMVDVDAEGRVHRIVIKPTHTKLRYSWLIAVWTPVFSDFMHNYLATKLDHPQENELTEPKHEIFLGDVLKAWMDLGLPIEAELFTDGACIDIGTTEDLIQVSQANKGVGWRWQVPD